jgi:hypothetical protein
MPDKEDIGDAVGRWEPPGARITRIIDTDPFATQTYPRKHRFVLGEKKGRLLAADVDDFLSSKDSELV